MQFRKVKKGKAGIWRKLRYAAFPVLCIAILLAACQKNQDDTLVLFEGGSYNYKIVYSHEREVWEDKAIIKLYDGLKDLCGVAPELVVDTETQESEDSREILVGTTNRKASQLPSLGKTDCYWSVVIDEKQIVMNGSNEYMIGLAVDYLMGQWSEMESVERLTVSSKWTQKVTMRDFYRDGWLIKNIPAYQGDNTLATGVYNCGTYLTEYGKKDVSSNTMQSVWSTNETEVSDYAKALESNGYKEESHTSIENNQFYRYAKENQRVYINYYGNEQRATVELDESGRPSIEEISYTYEPKDGEQTEFYLFKLKMDPYGYSLKQEKNTSGYIDNGACMVVKCADNSVIVIDGGAASQMEADDRERFSLFLHEITGKRSDEVITISAWFVTHFDSDHSCGFPTLINANPERYKVERFMGNLPDLEATSKTDATSIVLASNALTNNYPTCMDVKLRTGDVLQIADVTIETLYTHEDFADEAGNFRTTNFNTTSTVLMVKAASGLKMLVTGDLTGNGENILCSNFSTASLKCDIFQQPHHNRSDISTIYEYANAQVMFFTQAEGTLTSNDADLARAALAKKWCSEWYCGGTETAGIGWANGKANLIYRNRD